MIPLFKVYMSPMVKTAIECVLDSGYITEGPTVKEVEERLREYLGVQYLNTTNSCTSALQLAFYMLGPGYYITTAMTCSATCTAIKAVGGQIIWADINPKTGNIDPASIEDRLLKYGHLPIKAIVPVHWAGYPCDLDEIKSLGDEYGIPVVEDAAHAFGAEYKNKKIGNHSRFVCHSYQAIKHMTAIDGGSLICQNEADYKRSKLLRWFGIDRDAPREDNRIEQDIKEAGFKYHMNDVNATVLMENLEYADFVVGRHISNGQILDEALQEIPGITLLERKSDRISAYWVYTLLVDNRERFKQSMLAARIAVSQVHSRLDHHTAFRSALGTELPGLDEFAGKHISLPCGWWVDTDNLNYIIQTVKAIGGL